MRTITKIKSVGDLSAQESDVDRERAAHFFQVRILRRQDLLFVSEITGVEI